MTRATYADVGRALRQSARIVNEARCTQKQHRLWNAIVIHVASWSRLDDKVALGTLADTALLDRRDAQRAAGQLRDLGAIVYEPGVGGYGRRARVGLPAAAETAGATAHPSSAGEVAHPSTKTAGGTAPETVGAAAPETAGATAHPYEKYREDLRGGGGAGARTNGAAPPPLLDEECMVCGDTPSRDYGDEVLCDDCAGARASC